MHLRLPALILVVTLHSVPLFAAEGDHEEPKRTGFLGRVARSLNPFGPKEPRDRLNDPKAPNWKQLELKMLIEPLPVKLPETRQLKVTLQLTNTSKKFVRMDFPTSQRVEVLVRTRAGKLVEQWSEDQSFANEPTLVVVNPRERLEYSVSVATRDMEAGETYIIEALFPNFEPLRIQKTIIPEK